MTRAAYPGTFDPMTLGHADIARRAAALFDELVVAVGSNPAKSPLFDADQRVAMARDELASLDNVTVEPFDGLLVDFLAQHGLRVVVRGVRTAADLEYEQCMAFTNGAVLPDLETLFLPAAPRFRLLNAGLIKEVATRADDLSAFLSDAVAARLREKLRGGRTMA